MRARLAFGVWRSEFGRIGIAPGEKSCSNNKLNNYHSKIAAQPGNAKRQTPNEQR
jgi:hypothetical protein